MSLPDGFAPLLFDAARGVPQAVPLPDSVPGLRAALVGGTGDLARLMSAPTDLVAHDATELLTRRATDAGGSAAGAETAAHVVAHRAAVTAFTAAPPDSLTTAAVPLWVLVLGGSTVHGSWPALPGRALPVRGDGRFLGEVWIDELLLAAGSLVRPGQHGSRIVIGWRPAGEVTSGAATIASPTAASGGWTPVGSTGTPGVVSVGTSTVEEDPYAGLV
jgi:hypothetical protein